MKTLALCLAFVLAPPGGGSLAQHPTLSSPPAPSIVTSKAPLPATVHLQAPALAVREIPMQNSAGSGSTVLTLGLTGFLVLLTLYFYRISIELGREAMRRDRLARRFVERSPKPAAVTPIQDQDVDAVASLLTSESLLEAS